MAESISQIGSHILSLPRTQCDNHTQWVITI